MKQKSTIYIKSTTIPAKKRTIRVNATAIPAEKLTTSTTKAKPWDPNSEKQWNADKAAGGAAWALRFLELARAKPADYALQGWIDDAEWLFKGNVAELKEFYATLQIACLIPVGHVERN